MHSSFRHTFSLLFFAVCFFALTSPHHPEKSQTPAAAIDEGAVRLSIVVPESDSTSTVLSRHRIAANTDPQNKAFINGKEVKVHASGAFVGLVDLPVGKHTAKILVQTPDGTSHAEQLFFHRKDPDSLPAADTDPEEEDDTYDDKNFPRVAEINARRAFLNSGSGTDRLGGARLGFLERGVRLEVIDREGSHYRVRLSETFEGWLPVRFAELLPEGTPMPHSLTGSATVTGTEAFDMVTLSLGQRLPYIANMHTHPNTIEIDIFGAESNTNWITHRKSADGIRSVGWEQIATNHVRLIIHLEHENHWGFHIGYGVGTSLRIQIQRPPRIASIARPLEGMNVALDAGHGGSNRGALGATGVMEKDIVLAISKKLRDRLEAEGARVFMTRDRDVNVSMTERSEMIIASNAQVLVSVHANSIGSATNPDAIFGTSSYYRHDAFQPLARLIHNRMLELPLGDFGLIGSFNFTLNELTEIPNVLVETAFISHPEDEMMLLDPDYQDRMAEKILEGLRDYFLRYGKQPQMAS